MSVGDVKPIAEAPYLIGTEGPIFANAVRRKRGGKSVIVLAEKMSH